MPKDKSKSKEKAKAMIDKESVIIKLTLLVGACRTPNIKKKEIEQSLENYLKELIHAK